MWFYRLCYRPLVVLIKNSKLLHVIGPVSLKKTLRSKHLFSSVCPLSHLCIKHSSMHTYIMALYNKSQTAPSSTCCTPLRLVSVLCNTFERLLLSKDLFLSFFPEYCEVNLSSIRPMTRHSTNKSFRNWSVTVHPGLLQNASQEMALACNKIWNVWKNS